ncbi:helix-turn-helix domain-containing protein [Opitutus terrae]|nr:helix-turn-helix transcriptional regulator [Opitutus terrae]
MEQFALSGWAVIFPPTPTPGSRPVFMAHGIRPESSPLLTLAAKNGIEAIIPPQGFDGPFLATLARQISPLPSSRCRVLRNKRDRGGEFILFCYRAPADAEFSGNEMMALGGISRLVDRCFVALAQAQEQEFEAGLFRMVGNIHPEGLCVLDNRLRVIFENRKFKEHMHVWNGGFAALQNLSLPRQSELPEIWKEACDRCFRAFREVKFPPVSGRMAVSQGSVSELKHKLDTETWLEGAVRYLAFQTPLGVRPYLILTCSTRRQVPSGMIPLAQICERLGFSRRESELAELILEGSSAREIAVKLKIALPTVKTHIRHILQKAGVSTRLQFVGLCRPQA